MALLDLVAAERHRFADLIDSLTPEQLDTPSLCGEWTVRQVAGHVVAPFATRRSWFLPLLLHSRFSLHRANAELARMVARRPVAELTGELRRNARNPFAPPVVGQLGQLTDLQVHAQDVRRPLGLAYALDPEPARTSLDFLVSRRSVAFGPRRLRGGLRFATTDLDWAWGDGPEVRGTAEAIMMALTGRTVVLPELTGDGAAVLRKRSAR
ncbi:maleylpyruvate isomerase family mycothiol-dependent enzyme [Micromonospora siamensis]|uniref:maleylpyruvate isomerase family mycothiol-dependent enzyme n=1 Tax=Micromonospora siamensis TaxID=299152 RepID=UPI0012FD2C70|nr:maleylpyruvate isomerase family mycothiol-dependent enzyme [Micromonospora siamensis]